MRARTGGSIRHRAGRRDQCFTYDWARRLTDAWSSGDKCATKSVKGAGTPNLGTTDPYRTSWTYTDTSQRGTETQYKAGAITANTIRTYAYPTTIGAVRPHAVTSVAITGGTTGTDAYTYDSTGSLIKKAPAGGAVQDLTWNEEGKLKTSTVSGQSTSFLYDAEGTRIVKRDPAKTTLYLPGGQELELTRKNGTTAANISNGTRYYSVPGGSVIRSSADTVRILVSDHHNTNTLSIGASTLTVDRRKAMPFGAPRGAAPFYWPGTKGFVGGDIDTTTGFTHIGAREYDPKLGQFISVDPLLSLDLPRSLNGYTYANNSPITSSDPTGLVEICGSLGNACQEQDYNEDGTDNTDNDRSTSDTESNSGTNDDAGTRKSGTANNDDADEEEIFPAVEDYMLDELTNNARSLQVKELQHLNRPWAWYDGLSGRNEKEGGVTAVAAWIKLVCSKFCPWDRKPILSKKFSLDESDHFINIPGTRRKSYYGIWSNIHYGYVGRATGFKSKTVVGGAEVADPIMGKSDEGDRMTMRAGIDMFDKYGLDLTREQFHSVVMEAVNDMYSRRVSQVIPR